MFNYYKDIAGLTIHPSTKFGYDFDFIMELLSQFNIITILRFLKKIEHHFNIPVFTNIITSSFYKNIEKNFNENYKKTLIIMTFLKLIKKYFLIDNAISLIKQITSCSDPFAQKIKQNMVLQKSLLQPIVLGQVYGQYQGSVIPFYIHTSSWYIRTRLFRGGIQETSRTCSRRGTKNTLHSAQEKQQGT
jgi:uncharacterized membrane protein YbjE (DUF340 family)